MRTPLVLLLVAAFAVCSARSLWATETRAYILTSDFTSPGGIADIDLDDRSVSSTPVLTHSDARVRWNGGLLYVVNRYGQDNIQVIDPTQGFATLHQFSVGNGSNPQDIVVASPTKAYVTRLASTRLLIVNPETGDSTGAISLAAFADADGLPEMDRMILVGRRLFVAIERLANFLPTDASLVAVVDTDADTLTDADPDAPGVQAIVLPGTNPITTFSYDRGSARLLIGCVGSYGALDGGVAWIDPFALTSDGWAITETALGGDVLDVAWGEAARSFAIVSDNSFNTSLVAWSAVSGQLLSPIFSPGGFSLSDAGLDDRGELYVCDNSLTSPGVHVFSAASGAPLAGPLDTGLPPIEVVFDQSADPASVAAPPARGLVLGAPWPQPARGRVSTQLDLAAPAEVTVEVLDMAGRRVRTIAEAGWSAGRRMVQWDGLDQAGRRVPPGVYLLRARAGEASRSRRVVIAF